MNVDLLKKLAHGWAWVVSGFAISAAVWFDTPDIFGSGILWIWILLMLPAVGLLRLSERQRIIVSEQQEED